MKDLAVLAIAPALPPIVGGAQVSMGQYLCLLASHGVRTSVISGNTPSERISRLLLESGGEVIVEEPDPGPPGHHWESGIFKVAARIREVVVRGSFDIIHCFCHASAVSAAIALSGLEHRPFLVCSFHEVSTEATAFGRGRSAFVYGLEAIDCVIGLSEFYSSVPLGYGIPRSKVRTARQGIDVSAFANGSRHEGRAFLGIEPSAFMVLLPSRFTRRKGQLDLLAALAAIGARERGMVAILAGSLQGGNATFLAEIEEKISARGLRGVARVVMNVPYERMPDLIMAADVVVQTSSAEGLGLAALETMAAGVPLIASKASGFNEYCVAGENCLQVAPGDPGQLAEALLQIHRDPALRARLVARAKRTARSYSHEYQLVDNLAIYEELLAGRRSARTAAAR